MAKKNDSDVNRTPLDKYHRSKKVLTPPLATVPNLKLSSWVNDRLPEMLWAILIRSAHPGDTGYAIFRDILRWLAANKGEYAISGVTHSDINTYSSDLRLKFIRHIIEVAGTNALRPLMFFEGLPSYGDWKEAIGAGLDDVSDKDLNNLVEALSGVMFHQTQEATDVRWVKLMGTILSGKIYMTGALADKIEEFNRYPNYGDQRSVRPSIRSMEMMGFTKETDSTWPSDFWDYAYKHTECIPEHNKYTTEKMRKNTKRIIDEKKFFSRRTHNAWQKLITHYYDTVETSDIDKKHESVFGIALFALDTFIEITILQTAGGITGRVAARIIFECYITLLKLAREERDGNPLWDAYRDYGIGQINLVNIKYRESEYNTEMVDRDLIDAIANEDRWSEFVPINLGQWNSSDLRKLSISLGVKSLYDKYYPYTSSFIHGSWGAIRETSMQTCINPLHRYHRIPTYSLPMMTSVTNDSRLMLNKIFSLVDQLYPKFSYRFDKFSQR